MIQPHKVGEAKFYTWDLGWWGDFLGTYDIEVNAELLDDGDLFLGRATSVLHANISGRAERLAQSYLRLDFYDSLPGSHPNHLRFRVKADELTNTQRVRFTSFVTRRSLYGDMPATLGKSLSETNVIALNNQSFEAYFGKREFRAKNVRIRDVKGNRDYWEVYFPLE